MSIDYNLLEMNYSRIVDRFDHQVNITANRLHRTRWEMARDFWVYPKSFAMCFEDGRLFCLLEGSLCLWLKCLAIITGA